MRASTPNDLLLVGRVAYELLALLAIKTVF